MSLFLSRLMLNAQRREAQRDLADCYALHQRVLSAFSQAPAAQCARDRLGVLYRVETQNDRVALIVQSAVAPEWERLPPGYLLRPAEVKSIDPLLANLRTGMILRFRLVANPTRRVSAHNAAEPERWHGKRVAVQGEAQRLAWLARKGEQCGFAVLPARVAAISDAQVIPQAEAGGQRPATGRITLSVARFDGRLRIIDAERFRQTLHAGIGSGKAFGMGLLSIAPDTPHV